MKSVPLLNQIAGKDSEILQAVMEVMETEKLLASGAGIDIVPGGSPVLLQLGEAAQAAPPRPPRLTQG
mgnify:CR=1 FL=1